MFDRYSTRGIYSLFSHKIVVDSFEDIPVFLHEFYHHVQNVTTIHGTERFNLLMQLLAHITNLGSIHTTLQVPLNRWFEQEKGKKTLPPKIEAKLENLVYHQDLWVFMDKKLMRTSLFEPHQLINPFLAIYDEKYEDSKTAYIITEKDGFLLGHEIGGFAVTESGAYALQLIHENRFLTLPELETAIDNPQNRPYLIILFYVSQFVEEPQVACLLTFLVCDLAMCASTPAVGFLLIATILSKTIKPTINHQEAFDWYENLYNGELNDLIYANYQTELDVILDLKKQAKHLISEHALDGVFKYELELMENSLHYLRLDKRLQMLHLLLTASKYDHLTLLLQFFPTTIVEIKEEWYYQSERHANAYEILNAAYELLLGLCRDFNYILEKPHISKHFTKIAPQLYKVNISQVNDEADAYGYLLHVFGFGGKTISLI